MELKAFCAKFDLRASDVEALCQRHAVSPSNLDAIPHPTDASVYVSYGPADDDVELRADADAVQRLRVRCKSAGLPTRIVGPVEVSTMRSVLLAKRLTTHRTNSPPSSPGTRGKLPR